MALEMSALRIAAVFPLGALLACSPPPAAELVPGERMELVHPGAPHGAQVSEVALAVDADGDAVLAWIRTDVGERSVRVARRAAADFAVAEVDTREHPPLGGHQAPGLALGADGRTHLSWSTRRPDPDGSAFASDLVLASSGPGGDGFGRPLRLHEDAPGSRGFEALAVGAGGAVVAAWIEPGRSARIRAARVGEGSVGAPVTLAVQACPCCRVAAAGGEDGRVHLLWRDEFEGGVRDMVFAREIAGGAFGFGVVERVAEDGWEIAACPHHGGALAVAPDGRALVAWYSEGRGSAPGLWLAWSAAQGFAAPQRIHEQSTSLPDRVAVAVDSEGRGIVLWERATPVRSEIAARTVPPGGGALGPVRVLSRGTAARNPALVRAPGGGFLAAWQEESFPTLRTVVVPLRWEGQGAPLEGA